MCSCYEMDCLKEERYGLTDVVGGSIVTAVILSVCSFLPFNPLINIALFVFLLGLTSIIVFEVSNILTRVTR